MHKKTSIRGLAIATILTACVSALGFSNQAFAHIPLQNQLFSHVPHVGQILGGFATTVHNILKGGITSGLLGHCTQEERQEFIC